MWAATKKVSTLQRISSPQHSIQKLPCSLDIRKEGDVVYSREEAKAEEEDRRSLSALCKMQIGDKNAEEEQGYIVYIGNDVKEREKRVKNKY